MDNYLVAEMVAMTDLKLVDWLAELMVGQMAVKMAATTVSLRAVRRVVS
jgi:hypothetical protein